MNCSFADKDPNHPCGLTPQNPTDTQVVPLSTCKRDMSSHLQSLRIVASATGPSMVSESDLILNRCGMFNVDEETAQSLTVCPVHRRSLTLEWTGRTRNYCAYPLHKKGKPKISTNNRRINKVFSEEIFTLHDSVVPIGSAICGSCRLEHYKLRHIEPSDESTSEEKSNSEAQSADEVQTEVSHASTSSFTPRTTTDTPIILDQAQDSESSGADTQSSSSIPDHEISLWQDEKTNQNEKRDVLNSAIKEISDGRCSPLLSTLNTEWNDVSQRSQYYYVKKTKDILTNVLHTIAPGQENNLWQAVKRSADPFEDQEEPEVKRKKWDSESVKSLVAAYNASETSQTRTQILSIFAYDFQKSELQELIPGLSMYKIDTARKHATEIGAGKPVPEQEIKRCRLDPAKIDHFLDFISTPTYLQDTAYGTRIVKMDDGSKLTMPNAIRTVIPTRIISQYKSYCESINFEPASESTLWRVLHVCPASHQKSLQGLDYFSTEGGNAFDTLKDIVTTLTNKGLNDRKSKDIHQELKDGKFYLKTDFKAHIADQDECPDHCCSYALSDIKDSAFSAECNHEHTLQCNRCYQLDCVLDQMKQEISAANVPEDERQRLDYDFDSARTDILAWKAHILRTYKQEAAKYDILRTLDDRSVLLVMDWAMKYLPTRFREKMTDFYGKRGRSWHVSSVISKSGQELEVECYVHIFDSCTQNWIAVASIVEDVLCNVKKEDPHVENVYLKSDNAGCYHSTQLLSSLPEIGKRTGITVQRYDFSDPQSGKDICDRKIASLKGHIRRYVNEKHDVITADDMKTALDSHTGVKGCRVAVAEVCIDHDSVKTVKSIEGISFLNNFAFNEDGASMHTWRSYNIGVGKVVDIESGFQGPTKLKIVRPFNETTTIVTKGTVKSVASASSVSTSSLFYCEEQGCIQTFHTYAGMQQHMDTQQHTTETEKVTTYDRIRKKWAKKVEHVQTDREAHTEASTSELTSEMVEGRVDNGWALKKSRKPQRMTASVKQFLTDKFNEGAKSGHKADSDQVAEEMKYLRNVIGGLMFSASEWRSSRQISSFFSRLSALQRMKTADSEAAYDEDDFEMWNAECDHVERRNNVINQLDILHPIMYKSFDLCQLGRQHKLKSKFKIKDLQEICKDYDIETDGPVSRKDSYISPLLAFLQGCSCTLDEEI